MIDYAHHLIKIENLAKQASLQCLDRKYESAKETANLLATEARLLAQVCALMSEQEDQWGKKHG